ncbi:hypothetical protein HDE68_002459 [Pedobacter cryoconitis]|uniref:Uncharacterized protein n=1 Tax=Pedobacter cryoconitis TaxID=188932 RepID=A0A7W8ZM61_9SPHI|nr:hypothetical protein [Pedobacter cryoconitis]
MISGNSGIRQDDNLRTNLSFQTQEPQYRHLSTDVKPIQDNLLKRKVISGKSYKVK